MRVVARVRSVVAHFARQAFWLLLTRHPLTPDVLPDHLLRCQHCDRLIRLAALTHPAQRTVSGHTGPLFTDDDGGIVCDRAHRILHRPMPSILG